jgi:SAM-dependent methyltransferase
MSLYRIAKVGYKLILAKAIRNAIYSSMPTFLKVVRAKAIQFLERSALHDEIYDEEYYVNTVDYYMARSCHVIAESIAEVFSPSSVVDVGCGSGLLLFAMKERGISSRGVNCSRAALDICRRRGLEAMKFDLERDRLLHGFRADVAISMEVAEHLPESCADRFVDTLCRIADNVVITAAEPGPSYVGTDHVNEQPNEYWISKFKSRGFRFECELTTQWRKDWKAQNVASCYIGSLMVFRKA